MSVPADMAAALRLLTVLPVGGAEGTHPVRYFTWVGILFGAVGVGVAATMAAIGRAEGLPALVAGALVVCVWAALSGSMHLDGVADCADALGVRGDRSRKLTVMRDSTVGAFGVVALVLALMVETVSIGAIIGDHSWWALAMAPILGRFGAGVALLTRAPARPEGLAATYTDKGTVVDCVVLAAPVVLTLCVAPHLLGVLAALAGAAVALAVPRALDRVLGGITGDVLGATIVLTESCVLMIAGLGGGSA